MADAIKAAIEAAAAKATEAQPAQVAAAVPVVASAPGSNLVQYKAPTPPSAADMMTGSFSVDAYLKVSEHGMTVDGSGLITDPFRVVVDLSETFYYYAVKYGNPAIYKKSLDQVRATDGTPWQDVKATALRVDSSQKFKGDYRSGDIPMVLLSALKDVKGTAIEKAVPGTRVGKSLSTTEWREWEQMLRSIQKKGINLDTAWIEVEVGFKKRTNAASNTWGVLTFTFVKEVVEDESVAAA